MPVPFDRPHNSMHGKSTVSLRVVCDDPDDSPVLRGLTDDQKREILSNKALAVHPQPIDYCLTYNEVHPGLSSRREDGYKYADDPKRAWLCLEVVLNAIATVVILTILLILDRNRHEFVFEVVMCLIFGFPTVFFLWLLLSCSRALHFTESATPAPNYWNIGRQSMFTTSIGP